MAVTSGGGRERGNRAIVGQAVERPPFAGNPGNINVIFYPWNSYYSRYGGYYGYGYGYNYGFGYSPCSWTYGCSPFWYDPFYDPFYRYGYGNGGYGRYGATDPYDQGGYSSSTGGGTYEPERRMGSLRIKAKPAAAKVYIDGVLVGIVDDFDGLTNHLELEAGPHELEVRADGYATLVKDITVKSGQTTTQRLSLKKK